MVVFLFLRSGRATLIPAVAVPVSLIGTFGVMYLLGFSLDNLSLMALTVATGFVVDDAIVVLENISRHIEAGMPRFQAALLRRARGELHRSVDEPVAGGGVHAHPADGRHHRPPVPRIRGDAVGRDPGLAAGVAVDHADDVRLFPAPPAAGGRAAGADLARVSGVSERVFERARRVYARSLAWSLRHAMLVLLILAATLCLNVFLFTIVPKGFFPQQDTGRLIGSIQADQSISFQLMSQKLTRFIDIVHNDKAVASVVGFTGGGQTNGGFVFASLKPHHRERSSITEVIARLRREMAVVPGATLFFQASQDIRVGGRQANAQYQYTLQGDDLDELNDWAPKITAALQQLPALHRRQFRPAEQGPRNRSADRPRRGGAAGLER